MITTVEELIGAILDEHWVPNGTEVRRVRRDGVMTTTVLDLETGFEVLTVQEEHEVITGEVVAEPQPGLPRGPGDGLYLSPPRE